jgi:hypothetical protein
MSVATLRSDIAAALVNPTVWQVFSYPPATPLANSVVITPDDPYVVPSNNTWNIDATVNFKLRLIVPLLDNQGNLGNIEGFMLGVLNKLYESDIQFRIGSFSEPSVLPTDAGQMLTSDITITSIQAWE